MNAACDGCVVAETAAQALAPDSPVAHGGERSAGGRQSTQAEASRPSRSRSADSSAIPGMSRRDLTRLLAPIAPDDTSSADGGEVDEERFARAALGAAIEPGDQVAGRLVDDLGPIGLLRLIIEGHGASGDAGAVAASQPPHDDGSPTRAPTGPRADRSVAEALARWRPKLSLTEAVRTLERTHRLGARLVTPGSAWWPEGLASLDEGPPLVLWIRGEGARLLRLGRSVALVGARASTDYGEHVAMESAAGLADRGFAVVSGGAYGIDAAAHRAALVSGGLTVAFLAGGIDRLYPAGNSELLKRIAREGVVVAELPPGTAPTRWRFLMRNRLIAAAATATVVVEAGRRSGSLNTAGHAAQMGRPLGAVPGSVLSPASAGCHRLIREYDATCVTTTAEMAELAEPFVTAPPPVPGAPEAAGMSGGSDAERTVLSTLANARAASADEIAARAALPFTTVAAVLGRLDVAGRARESAGGWSLTDRKCL